MNQPYVVVEMEMNKLLLMVGVGHHGHPPAIMVTATALRMRQGTIAASKTVAVLTANGEESTASTKIS